MLRFGVLALGLALSLPLPIPTLASSGRIPTSFEHSGGLERAHVVNGVSASDFPEVGALVVPPSGIPGPPVLGDAKTVCSGTLIGCDTFLTAAHCVCTGNADSCVPGGADEMDASRFGVFLPRAGYFEVSEITIHPDYAYPADDVAVLKLDRPVEGVRPARINTLASPPAGTNATIVGFGRGGGSDYDYGLKRKGQVTLVACEWNQLCWEFDSPVAPAGLDSNTCAGDSGGPLIWDSPAGPVVAGITSGGHQPDCLADDESFDMNVYRYRTFIAEAADSLSNAACGAGPQVGDTAVQSLFFEGTLTIEAPEAAHVFHVDPGTRQLRVAIHGSEHFGTDFDLLVKRGGTPTLADHDCTMHGSGQYGFCEIDFPGEGAWALRVIRRAGAGPYQISTTEFGDGCTGTNEGAACDDGNSCTTGDVCTLGICTGSVAADGTLCSDGFGCTSGDQCVAGTCLSFPRPHTSCDGSIQSNTSLLSIRDLANPGRDTISWSLRKGEATHVAAFGVPTAEDPVDFCVWDWVDGTPTLISEVHIPAGDNWTSTRNGYRYRDNTRIHGGVHTVTLNAGGSDGRTTITLRAKGIGTRVPDLPLDQSPLVMAQLVTKNGCWETTHSTPLVNGNERYRAKND